MSNTQKKKTKTNLDQFQSKRRFSAQNVRCIKRRKLYTNRKLILIPLYQPDQSQ